MKRMALIAMIALVALLSGWGVWAQTEKGDLRSATSCGGPPGGKLELRAVAEACRHLVQALFQTGFG